MGHKYFEQMFNICVMSSTCFIVGLGNPLMCRVIVLERYEFWWHRAYLILVVDTKSSIISALRGKVFSKRVEVYGSNQNSSADRLGLNPIGLTKWEEHFMRGYFGSYLNADFVLEGNTLVRAMLLWTRLSD